MTTIHIGLAKAASTFLQQSFAKHPGIDDYSDIRPSPVISELRKIHCEDEITFRIDRNVFPKDADNLVISNEGLSMSGRVDRLTIARRLYSIYPSANILIIIRQRTELISSVCYQHLRKSGLFRKFKDINDWLDEPHRFSKHLIGEYCNPINRLYYARMIEEYVSLFPAVLVLPYERLAEDPQAFVSEILNFCGVSDYQINPRPLNARQKRRFRYDLNDKWLEAIGKISLAENERLSQFVNTDMSHY